MKHYEVEYWQNGQSLFMIIRCQNVDRVIPIFRSIVPESDIITLRPLL